MKRQTFIYGLTVVLGLSLQAQVITSTTFGSSNDGTGGYEFNTAAAGESWTTNTDNYAFRNENGGNVHNWLVQEVILNRSSGASYTIEGTVTIGDGYADDNNRLGLIAFTDLTTVTDRDNTGQVGLIWNTDDGSTGGSPGSNSPDAIGLWNGYNNAGIDDINAPDVLRDQTTAFSQDLFGQTGTTSFAGTPLTFTMDIDFVGADVEITGSMTYGGNTTSLGTATALAADFTGDYFGFVSYARARNYDELDPDAAGNTFNNRARPWEVQYESFSITQTAIPEPSSVLLMAIGFGGILFYRRMKR